MTVTLDPNADTTARYHDEGSYCEYFIVPERRCTKTGQPARIGYNVGFKSCPGEEYAQFAYESQAALYELGLAPPVVGEGAEWRGDCGWGYYTLHCKTLARDMGDVDRDNACFKMKKRMSVYARGWMLDDLHYDNLAMFDGRMVLIDCNPPNVYQAGRSGEAWRLDVDGGYGYSQYSQY